MIELMNLKIPVTYNDKEVYNLILKKLRVDKIKNYRFLKKSVDARKKDNVFYTDVTVGFASQCQKQTYTYTDFFPICKDELEKNLSNLNDIKDNLLNQKQNNSLKTKRDQLLEVEDLL